MSLFGTDGLRGEAGAWPLVPEALVGLGVGLGKASRGPILIGRDTRSSGEWIGSALQAGILSAGCDVIDLGIVPTPVVARCTARRASGLGLVISASHNPAQDNGIKVLRPDGTKSTPALERRLEAAIKAKSKPSSFGGRVIGETVDVEEDIDSLLHRFHKLDLGGLRIAIDTAHGAATWLAPDLLTELGADVVQIGASPNGRNINKKCGSMYLKSLARQTQSARAVVGFAFDGDADRCLAVDEQGEVLDGDHLLAILAGESRRRRWAGSDTVVGTVMTNGGLESWLKARKIKLVRTPVGDKYVVARMKRSGAALGGENSGHIVMARDGMVGDGCLTMLAVLEALSRHDFEVSSALAGYEPWPQELINVRVRSKPDLLKRSTIKQGARVAEARLKGQGRLLLRYSGTEPLARVMVEGADSSLVSTVAQELATIIKEDLGA